MIRTIKTIFNDNLNIYSDHVDSLNKSINRLNNFLISYLLHNFTTTKLNHEEMGNISQK